MTGGLSSGRNLRIAVVGAGVGGLSAAWLLSRGHHVSLFEQARYLGGHSNTVEVPGGEAGSLPVDTGFIVYNEVNYPNLVQLFKHLGVATAASDMSFAVSLRGGTLEYAGTNLAGLFAQPGNLLKPRFWRMLSDLRRFYRDSAAHRVEAARDGLTLRQLLTRHGYTRAFLDDHLLPMAGAIWSATGEQMLEYPARTFLDFCANHGLVQFTDRPVWRTVDGGSRQYVRKLVAGISGAVHIGASVVSIERLYDEVELRLEDGRVERFDHVVIGAHADQALHVLVAPSEDEQRLLGAFRYSQNRALLHEDQSFMPQRRAAWASWNHLGEVGSLPTVTYWMNNLQPLKTRRPLFVTLNPPREPRAGSVHREFQYAHPLFDSDALDAQDALWRLQGQRNTWFCGSYFGYGFHEDALESGLWVAEALGGSARPWAWDRTRSRTALGRRAPAMPA